MLPPGLDPNAIHEFECHCWPARHEGFDRWPWQPSIWQTAPALGMEDVEIYTQIGFEGRALQKISSWVDMVTTLLRHGASPTVTLFARNYYNPEKHPVLFGGNKLYPKKHSVLFVCLYLSMVLPDCDLSLPELVRSKGGDSLRAGELEELGDCARSHPDLFTTRYAFLRRFYPSLLLSQSVIPNWENTAMNKTNKTAMSIVHRSDGDFGRLW